MEEIKIITEHLEDKLKKLESKVYKYYLNGKCPDENDILEIIMILSEWKDKRKLLILIKDFFKINN